jgi:hypothetical protein
MTFETAVGKLQLRSDVHGALLDLLHQGPITLREVVARLPQQASNLSSVTDILKILIGRGDLQPALPSGGDAQRTTSVGAFNEAVLARAVDNAEFGYLASAMTGGGVRVDRLTQLYLIAKARGMADPTSVLAKLVLAAHGAGDAPVDANTARTRVAEEVRRIEAGVVPTLKRVGVL